MVFIAPLLTEQVTESQVSLLVALKMREGLEGIHRRDRRWRREGAGDRQTEIIFHITLTIKVMIYVAWSQIGAVPVVVDQDEIP